MPTEANTQLSRYGHSFDSGVDQFCPPLVRNKNGAISKRQPRVQEMPIEYWKAQCSFRRLKTIGRKNELKDRIRNRDHAQDIAIKRRLDRAQALLDAEHELEEKARFERWWKHPTTQVETKIGFDKDRALKELLDQDPGILNSVLVLKKGSDSLVHSVRELGLSCQMFKPPRSMTARKTSYISGSFWSVLGREDLVQEYVNRMKEQTDTEAKTPVAMPNAVGEARKAEQQNRGAALLAKAKEMDDWDLTGSWSVQCTELATYSTGQPEKLSMEVYLDDPNPRGSDRDSEDQYDSYDECEGREQTLPGSAAVMENDANSPRYCAKFNFAVVEGVMRIYSPPRSSRSKTTPWSVKANPRFHYIWRGRETGESQIQTNSDEEVYTITFGNHGTTFEGVFHCPFMRPLKIVGRKTTHGHGRKLNSENEWYGLSEDAWESERVGRWGRWR